MVLNVPLMTKQERSEVVSSFSIRSIQVKTEAQKNVKEEVIDPNSLPREAFSQVDFFKYWNAYIHDLESKGERIQAATLSVNAPQLNEKTIYLEVPNQTSKTEILNQEDRLLAYLRKSLHNYDISLEVVVNEEIVKKFLITPEDKYERLLEINPQLNDFRKAFDLTIAF